MAPGGAPGRRPRLAHLAVIVRDAGAPSVVPLGALGLAEREREDVTAEDATVSFVPVGGDGPELEFVQPMISAGSLSTFLATRGEGIHHLALGVPDIDTAIARAEASGLRFAGKAPRSGAGGSRIAFIHPSSLHGVLLELIEIPEAGEKSE